MAAHKLEKHVRTRDVMASENLSFKDLHLTAPVIRGLTKAGFEKPSPIQLKAIPLGRCGLDLIVQAKSGTGKTCVFSVIALDGLITNSPSTQVLVLAPTREIAVQIQQVVEAIGTAMEGLECHTFIGGLPLKQDIVNLACCHVAIGTPGRVKQLIDEGHLSVDSVRLFVLDEADKLMEDDFQQTVNWIYSTLPGNKQMLALSATYPEVLAQHLTAYMRNPTFIRLNTTDPALLGIRQYSVTTPFERLPQKMYEAKQKKLLTILSAVQFNQCLVFSNYQMRARSLCDVLTAEGWPAEHISGAREQTDRLTAMRQLKQYQCRVLVSTDLTARGIDAENVNLVINIDIPAEHETYLHRIGRAGRFGTYGAGISIVGSEKDNKLLEEIQAKCNTTVNPLPEPIPTDLASSSGFVYYDDLITTEQIQTDEPSNQSLMQPVNQPTTSTQTGATNGYKSLLENQPPKQYSTQINTQSLDQKDNDNDNRLKEKDANVSTVSESHLKSSAKEACIIDIGTERESRKDEDHTLQGTPNVSLETGTAVKRKSVMVKECAEAMSNIVLKDVDKGSEKQANEVSNDASNKMVPDRKSVTVKECAEAMSNIVLKDLDKGGEKQANEVSKEASNESAPNISTNKVKLMVESMNIAQQRDESPSSDSNFAGSGAKARNTRRKRPEKAISASIPVNASESVTTKSERKTLDESKASGDHNTVINIDEIQNIINGVENKTDLENINSDDPKTPASPVSSRPRARAHRKKKLHPWGDWIMTDENQIEADAKSRENRQRVSHDLADAIFDDVVDSELSEMDQKLKSSPEGSYFRVESCNMEKTEEKRTKSKSSPIQVKSPTFARSKTEYQPRAVVSYDDLFDSGASSGGEASYEPIRISENRSRDHSYAVPTSPSRRAMPKHLAHSKAQPDASSKDTSPLMESAGRQLPLESECVASAEQTTKHTVVRRKERQVVSYDDDLFGAFADVSLTSAETKPKELESELPAAFRTKPRYAEDASGVKPKDTVQIVKSKTKFNRPTSVPLKTEVTSKNVWDMSQEPSGNLENDQQSNHDDVRDKPRDYNPSNRSAVTYDDMDMFSVAPSVKKDKKKKKKKDRNEVQNKDEISAPSHRTMPEINDDAPGSSYGVGIWKNKATAKSKPTITDQVNASLKLEASLNLEASSGSKSVSETDHTNTDERKENVLTSKEMSCKENAKDQQESNVEKNQPALSQDVNSKKYKLLSRYNESQTQKIDTIERNKEVSEEEYSKAKTQLADLLRGSRSKTKFRRMGYEEALQDLTNYKNGNYGPVDVYRVEEQNAIKSRDIKQVSSHDVNASRDDNIRGDENKPCDDNINVAPICVEDLVTDDQENKRRKDIAECVSVLLEKIKIDTRNLLDTCESADYSQNRGSAAQDNGGVDSQNVTDATKERVQASTSIASIQSLPLDTSNSAQSTEQKSVCDQNEDLSSLGAVGGISLDDMPTKQGQDEHAQIVRPKIRPQQKQPKKGQGKQQNKQPNRKYENQKQALARGERNEDGDYIQSSSTDGYSSDFDSESVSESVSDSGAADSSDRGDYSIHDVAHDVIYHDPDTPCVSRDAGMIHRRHDCDVTSDDIARPCVHHDNRNQNTGAEPKKQSFKKDTKDVALRVKHGAKHGDKTVNDAGKNPETKGKVVSEREHGAQKGICGSCEDILAEMEAEEIEEEEEEETTTQTSSSESSPSLGRRHQVQHSAKCKHDTASSYEETSEEESDDDDDDESEEQIHAHYPARARKHDYARTDRHERDFHQCRHAPHRHREGDTYYSHHQPHRFRGSEVEHDVPEMDPRRHVRKGYEHLSYAEHTCPHHHERAYNERYQRYPIDGESNTSEDSHATYTCTPRHTRCRGNGYHDDSMLSNEYVDETLPRPKRSHEQRYANSVHSDSAYVRYRDRRHHLHDGCRSEASSRLNDASYAYHRRYGSRYHDSQSIAESSRGRHFYGEDHYGTHREIENAAQMYTHYQHLYWQQMAQYAPNNSPFSIPTGAPYQHMYNPHPPSTGPYFPAWNQAAYAPSREVFSSHEHPGMKRGSSYETLEANHRQLQDTHREWAEYYRKLRERKKNQAALDKEYHARREYIRAMAHKRA